MRQWLRVPLLVAAALFAVLPSVGAQAPPRETDLDRFMAAVLATRDENWRKLQQYILEERERVLVSGPGGARLFGMVHDYQWFVREGYFIRSPLAANGVAVNEDERRRREARWLQQQKDRDQRRAKRDQERAAADGLPPPPPAPSLEGLGDVLRQQSEPSFVQAAYFLRFKFEAGRYALAGKDRMDGREVLKVEYYPARLFADDDEKSRPERRAEQAGGRRRDRDDDDHEERIQQQLNKSSLVTLWILREPRQIVRYVFDNIDMGFMPGRSIARIEDLQASMTMGEPFPGIWLPKQVEARVAMGFAMGTVEARYDITYADYREAGVAVRVK